MQDTDVLRLAARQGGVVTRAQALDLGLTPDAIRHRTRTGTWTRIGRGIYRLLPSQDEREFLLAAVATLPDAVVSHTSAARLHGLEGVPVRSPTVTVVSSTTHRFEGVAVRRAIVGVPDDQRVLVDRLPTTTVARTIIDLAADLHRPVWEELAQSAIVTRRCSTDQLRRVADVVCGQGRPGSAIVGEFLADPGAGRSALERRVAALLAPLRPEVEYPAPWDPNQRLDFAFPEARVAVEVDGYRWHATRSKFEADRRRDRAAARHGWRIVRVTWSDIRDRPGEVLATIVALLEMSPTPI